MKLIIQIPCLNEESTLPLVFKNMPKKIPGVDTIEYQIIDDGSTDKTVEVAKRLGVHYIVTYRGSNRRWLGRAFKLGVDHAIKKDADILVNTDGDNQYPSERIPDLVRPILEGKAEIVIGDRQTGTIEEFSTIKKFLQKFGSAVTQLVSGGQVSDAVSGFRAYSREALSKINIVTDYTYTVDTLMQANQKGIDVAWVKIKVNPKTRQSRLIKNMWTKIKKSGSTIIRMYTIYQPLKFFAILGSLLFIVGILLIGRYVYFYMIIGEKAGHLQSLVAGGVTILVSFQMAVIGIVADLLAVNRRLIEDILERMKLERKD
ncbi:MAG: glycosyltransferase family 2 protein [Candidatus Dojkabacteria bacterium]|nr:glycosyltransferase family 2 protein [Candidatus Dojkabacteria bacterium]